MSGPDRSRARLVVVGLDAVYVIGVFGQVALNDRGVEVPRIRQDPAVVLDALHGQVYDGGFNGLLDRQLRRLVSGDPRFDFKKLLEVDELEYAGPDLIGIDCFGGGNAMQNLAVPYVDAA